MRSLPDCSGTCACLQMRGDDATSSITSFVQSMGSTELMRSFSIAVRSRIARSMSAKFICGVRSRPQRPRLMPDSTISR